MLLCSRMVDGLVAQPMQLQSAEMDGNAVSWVTNLLI